PIILFGADAWSDDSTSHRYRTSARGGAGRGSFLHQLFFAPSRIQARMALRSQVESFFFPCGMRTSGEPRQSSSHTRLLLSGSRGMTMGPCLVPFITPS